MIVCWLLGGHVIPRDGLTYRYSVNQLRKDAPSVYSSGLVPTYEGVCTRCGCALAVTTAGEVRPWTAVDTARVLAARKDGAA